MFPRRGWGGRREGEEGVKEGERDRERQQERERREDTMNNKTKMRMYKLEATWARSRMWVYFI